MSKKEFDSFSFSQARVSFDLFYSELMKFLEMNYAHPDNIPEVMIRDQFSAQTLIELYRDIIHGRECRGPIILLHHEEGEALRPVVILPATDGSLPKVFFPWMTVENSTLARLCDEVMKELDHEISLCFNFELRPEMYSSFSSPIPGIFPEDLLITDEHFCLYQLVYLLRRNELLGKTIHLPALSYDELSPAFDLFNDSLGLASRSQAPLPLQSVEPSLQSLPPPPLLTDLNLWKRTSLKQPRPNYGAFYPPPRRAVNSSQASLFKEAVAELLMSAKKDAYQEAIPIIQSTFSIYEEKIEEGKLKLSAVKLFFLSPEENLPVPDLSFFRSNEEARLCLNELLRELDKIDLDSMEQKCKAISTHLDQANGAYMDYSEVFTVVQQGQDPLSKQSREQTSIFDSLQKELSSGRSFADALILFEVRLLTQQQELQVRIMNGDFSVLDESEYFNCAIEVCQQSSLDLPCGNTTQESIRQTLLKMRAAQEEKEFDSIGADLDYEQDRGSSSSELSIGPSAPAVSSAGQTISDQEIEEKLTECLSAYMELKPKGLIEDTAENAVFLNVLQFNMDPANNSSFQRLFYSQNINLINEVLELQAACRLSLSFS